MPETVDDWTAPSVAEWEYLWDCFHDGELKSISFEPLERTLMLEIELGFPAPPEPCPNSVKLSFREVTHAVIFVYVEWTGPLPVHQDGMDREAWEAELRAYNAKFHVEGLSIKEATRLFAEDKLTILEARRSVNGDCKVIELDGYLEDADAWHRLLIAAKDLDVFADGQPSTMEEIIAFGRRGWDAWKRKAPDDESN